MKCYSCGVDKDLSVKEAYPYPEDDRLTEEPISPLMVIECSSIAKKSNGERDYRVVVVCHECFHKIDPDMWIGEKCWQLLNPKVPFDRLPKPADGTARWKTSSYPEIS